MPSLRQTELDSSQWYIITNTRFFTFDLDPGVMVTQNVAQYCLHYVAYTGTKLEVATSNGLEGDAFTRKYII